MGHQICSNDVQCNGIKPNEAKSCRAKIQNNNDISLRSTEFMASFYVLPQSTARIVPICCPVSDYKWR